MPLRSQSRCVPQVRKALDQISIQRINVSADGVAEVRSALTDKPKALGPPSSSCS